MARARETCAAKIETRQVAATAAVSPTWTLCRSSASSRRRSGGRSSVRRARRRRSTRRRSLTSTAAGGASTLDRGFLREHDRDVLADGVHALALAAAQAGTVLDQLHGRLADRAGQDLQEVW